MQLQESVGRESAKGQLIGKQGSSRYKANSWRGETEREGGRKGTNYTLSWTILQRFLDSWAKEFGMSVLLGYGRPSVCIKSGTIRKPMTEQSGTDNGELWSVGQIWPPT